jgi:hypothetical protein
VLLGLNAESSHPWHPPVLRARATGTLDLRSELVSLTLAKSVNLLGHDTLVMCCSPCRQPPTGGQFEYVRVTNPTQHVLDEAHRFKSGGTNMYQVGHQLIIKRTTSNNCMAFGLLGNKGMHASNGNTAAANKLLDNHFSPRLWKEVLGEIQERKTKLSPHLLEAIKEEIRTNMITPQYKGRSLDIVLAREIIWFRLEWSMKHVSNTMESFLKNAQNWMLICEYIAEDIYHFSPKVQDRTAFWANTIYISKYVIDKSMPLDTLRLQREEELQKCQNFNLAFTPYLWWQKAYHTPGNKRLCLFRGSHAVQKQKVTTQTPKTLPQRKYKLSHWKRKKLSMKDGGILHSQYVRTKRTKKAQQNKQRRTVELATPKLALDKQRQSLVVRRNTATTMSLQETPACEANIVPKTMNINQKKLTPIKTLSTSLVHIKTRDMLIKIGMLTTSLYSDGEKDKAKNLVSNSEETLEIW